MSICFKLWKLKTFVFIFFSHSFHILKLMISILIFFIGRVGFIKFGTWNRSINWSPGVSRNWIIFEISFILLLFTNRISPLWYSTNYVSLHLPLYPCLNYPIVYGLHIVNSSFCDALISKRIQSTWSMNRTKLDGLSKNMFSEVFQQSKNDENQTNE